MPSRSRRARMAWRRSAVSIRAGYSTKLRVCARFYAASFCCWRSGRDLDDVPGQPHPPHPADQPRRRVDLPPAQPVPRRARERVVVVVPALAEREQRQPEHVGRVVVDVEPARAEEVADRVDRPGDVVQREDPHRPAPQRGRQRAGERRRRSGSRAPAGISEARSSTQSAERAVDEPHAAVLVEVARVARVLGLAGRVEQPAHVRVPEAGDRALDAAAVPVRRVRVAVLVGVRVVLAVVGDPRHDRPLHGHRAEDRERVLDRLERLERAVREQPVEAERHAVAADHVHDQPSPPGRSSRRACSTAGRRRRRSRGTGAGPRRG